MKKINFLIAFAISSIGFSQTILNQSETASRTVQDPQTVIMLPGFHASSTTVNPFIAKIGNNGEGSGPVDSGAGATNPSGTIGANSFHDTQGKIEVSGGGQLQFTLPIALPPGVKSVAPQVNLIYTSGSGNGIAGYGWTLSGLTSISRVGKTIDRDGELKGIQLNNSDYYTFNGQRLILKEGSGTYGGDGAEYITENYSNVKIKSFGQIVSAFPVFTGPQYWEVTFEDGSQAWYGAKTENDGKALTSAEYNIVKWKDAQGNYITYEYDVSGTDGTFNYLTGELTLGFSHNVSRISKISWGGNENITPAQSHFNEMVFNYIDRAKNESSYQNSEIFLQSKLLTSIQVNTNGNQFKKYVFENTNNGTSYNFINKITEYNANNEAANPVTFDYQKDDFVQPTTFAQNSRFDEIYGENIISGDFNGDGKLDFIKDNKIMLGRLDGNGQIYDLNIQGVPLVAISFLNNNVFLSKQAFLTYSPDYSNKKITIYAYEYVNNTSVNLLKSYIYDLSQYPTLFDESTPPPPTADWDENGNRCPGYYDEQGNWVCKPWEYTYKLVAKAQDANFDGDGISDLLLTISQQQLTRHWEWDENGNFSQVGTEYIVRENKKNFFWGYANLSLVDSNFPDEIIVADFNGDGKSDLLKVENNNLVVYEMVTQGQFSVAFSVTKESLDDKMFIGDFNGDGKTDILSPIAEGSSDWRMYISTGSGFKKEFYPNLFLYKPFWQGGPTKLTQDVRTYATPDLNKDGKSDFLVFLSKKWYRSLPEFKNPDSTYGFDYFRNEGVDNNGKPILVKTSFITPDEKETDTETINYSMYGEHYLPLFGNFRIASLNTDFVIIHKTKLITWDLGNKINIISKIKSITQGGVKTDIEYSKLISTGNIYQSYFNNSTLQYPYVNITENLSYDVVSKLTQGSRKQDFRYRDMIGHLTGKGILGFRQIARSTFYADGYENTKIWSGSEMDPLNESLPLKEWSIKTNDENSIFPSNISLTNTQLLSYKEYNYKIDKLLNGTVVTTYSDAVKPKIVTSINPYTTISKDFQKDVKTVHTVETYNSIYLPTKSKTEIYDGSTKFATSTSEVAYQPSITNSLANYSIGKPAWKTETMQVYGDTKGGKEEYEYNGDLLTKKRTYNRDYNNSNAQYIEERYVYDSYGNIIEKTVENPNNNDDVQGTTIKSQYDTKGRFVVKKTDNLGLETNITYNDWGQVLTQTDPLSNTLTNTYDNWGKLLTSKTNLGGTTTYTYEKLSNGDSKVIEYAPDNDQKITYTNKLGQTYKTQVKGFKSGSFVTKNIQYDVLGRKISENEPYNENETGSKYTTLQYDDYSRPVKATSYTGKIIETSYNGRSVTATETSAYGKFKTQVFDAIGNVTSTADKGGTITFKYNAAGENIEAKYDKNIVITKYDNWGRKSEFNDPSNGIYKYEYNGYGQLIHVISPKGHKYYNYDQYGRLWIQEESSNDNTSTQKSIFIDYNDKGLITRKYGTSNGKAYSSYVNYDDNGRVISSGENSNGKYFYKKAITYDDKGRITSYEKGLISSGVNTKTVIENIYSTWSGEMYQLKEKNSSKILWELTEITGRGQVLKAKLGATNIENTYDSNDFLSNVSHKSVVNGNNYTVLQISYSFNAAKNELNSRNRGGSFNIAEAFTYDENNRLVNWTNPKTGQLSNNVYDAKGRILENDQVGTIKYDDNTPTVYRPTGATLNAAGQQNLTNNLIQSITYNENNDPIKITGEKGDVYFTYGLTNMRQAVGYGGKLDAVDEGKYTKFYSEDGSYEVVIDNITGREKHVLYIGGSPYESNIIFFKDYTQSIGSYKFLHKDYLGSILAITDETGYAIEQRHFDAWGNITHFIIAGTSVDPKYIENAIINRGYTSHEHFNEVGIIHMNGRLYDPLLRRFLNADENIQDPQNTQNYNKYGYVMNNPLMYSDPSGEFIWWIPLAIAAVQELTTMVLTQTSFSIGRFTQGLIFAYASAGMADGIGTIFQTMDPACSVFKALAIYYGKLGVHGLTGGFMSLVQGGSFKAGFLSSLFSAKVDGLLDGLSSLNGAIGNIASSKGFAMLIGAVAGGVGSRLGNGNFWVGAIQGFIVTTFNYLAHKYQSQKDEKPIIRKYLKNKTNVDIFGNIEDYTQYQLDHANWIDESEGTIKYLETIIDYLNTGAEYTGGVTGIKSIYDIIKDLKTFNPGSIPLMSAGSIMANESNNFNKVLEIYKTARSNYGKLHKYYTHHQKGVTVNTTVTITNHGNIINYGIYDIYTHRYLSGGTVIFNPQ